MQWEIPPLLQKKGSTQQDWQARRAEIIDLLAKNIYGITPDIPPATIHKQILEADNRSCGGKNSYKKIQLHYRWETTQATIEMRIYLPKGEKPVAALLMIDPFLEELHKNAAPEYLYGFFPCDIITDRGYAAIQLVAGVTCRDNKQGCCEGILGAFPGEEYKNHKWGAIGAWAWAAQRAMDYLETDPLIDQKKVVLVGCSRAGKAALWCGAQDTRFAAVLSNVSGLAGAAITRGKTGEHIKDIVTNFPYWFCPQYAAFCGNEEELPVDGHMLLAAIAPRPIYVASASEDVWADIDAEYQSCLLAKEIYESIYSLAVNLPDKIPPVNRPIRQGVFGYHLREGIHDLLPYDWSCYLDFCDAVL